MLYNKSIWPEVFLKANISKISERFHEKISKRIYFQVKAPQHTKEKLQR